MNTVLTEPIEIFATGNNYAAKGLYYPDGKVKLFKGSVLCPYATNSTRANIVALRNEILHKKAVGTTLTSDVVFETHSEAASVLSGTMRNGHVVFRTVDNIPLGEYLGEEDAPPPVERTFDQERIQSFLEGYDEWMRKQGAAYIKREKEKLALLDEFQHKFQPESLRSLPLEEYVSGKGQGTFCWWVETRLEMFGGTAGQLTAVQRYGIYWSSKNQRYEFLPRWGNNETEVYGNVIDAIVNAIDAIERHDLRALVESKLNPMFKNKLSYLYAPDTFVPIYGEDKIDTVLTLLDISFDRTADRIYRRELLFKFLQALGREDITSIRFADFIYSDDCFGKELKFSLPKQEETPEREGRRFRLVDVDSLDEISASTARERHGLVVERPETVAQKKITGKTAEEIVKQYLLSHKAELGIVGEVVCCCEFDDYRHHDFSYVDSGGDEIFIEVKSTKANQQGKVTFEMSDAEYRFMQEHIEHFFVYYVNDAYCGDEILRIPGKLIVAHPCKYRINMERK